MEQWKLNCWWKIVNFVKEKRLDNLNWISYNQSENGQVIFYATRDLTVKGGFNYKNMPKGVYYRTQKHKNQAIKNLGENVIKGNHPKSEFKKGHIPWNKDKKGLQIAWNKGKPWSEETKRKISETLKGNKNHLGKHHTLETRKKISLVTKGKNKGKYRGDKHWNWKGGKRREKHASNWKYAEWRGKVFEYDNFTCWTCEEKGGYLIGHHLKSWSEYPELRYEVSNGLTLCGWCHKIYTLKRKERKNENSEKRVLQFLLYSSRDCRAEEIPNCRES